MAINCTVVTTHFPPKTTSLMIFRELRRCVIASPTNDLMSMSYLAIKYSTLNMQDYIGYHHIGFYYMESYS